MWYKVDVFRKFCDRECYFFFEMKDECKVTCVKIFLCRYIWKSVFI